MNALPLISRHAFPVLVAECASIGAIAVVRSLGRAGYPVHAVAGQSDALGLRSRFARHSAVHPPLNGPQFLPWLNAYVERHGIRLIIPSESFLRAIRADFRRYAPLLPVPDDPARVYAALSKYSLFAALLEANETHLAPTVLIRQDVPIDRGFAQLSTPIFLKVDADEGRNLRAAVEVFEDRGRAAARADALSREYGRVVAQGYVPGQGVGVFLCRWGGRVLASFMHRRIHEVPYTGGVSSLRESWFDERILTHARRILERLGWQGVAMLEYRWEAADGRFWLIEVNARFWGSLHLALHAGIDFPCILADAVRGEERATGDYPSRVLCRNTFPGEVQHVWSKLKDPRLSTGTKFASVANFLVLSLDPRVYEDLLYPGDRMLYFRNFWRHALLWLRAFRRR